MASLCKYLFFLFFFSICIAASAGEISSYLTVAEYSYFLNKVASTDPHHLYDEKMATTATPIIRQGELGNYSYSFRAGDEKKSLLSMSLDSAKQYAHWKANKDILPQENQMLPEQGVYDFQEGEVVPAQTAMTEPLFIENPNHPGEKRGSELDEKLRSNRVAVLLKNNNQSNDFYSSDLLVLSFLGSMFLGAECYRYHNRSIENRRLEDARLEELRYKQMLASRKRDLEESEDTFFKKQSEAMRVGNSSQDLLLLSELAKRAENARKIAEEIWCYQKNSSKIQTNESDVQHSYGEYLSWRGREECWTSQRNAVLEQELFPLTGPSCKKFLSFPRVIDELRAIMSSTALLNADTLIESREEIKKNKTWCEREINGINKMPELTLENLEKKIFSFKLCSEKIEKLRGATLTLIYKKKLLPRSEKVEKKQEFTEKFSLLKEEDSWHQDWRTTVEKFYQQQELLLGKIEEVKNRVRGGRRQTF